MFFLHSYGNKSIRYKQKFLDEEFPQTIMICVYQISKRNTLNSNERPYPNPTALVADNENMMLCPLEGDRLGEWLWCPLMQCDGKTHCT